MDTFKVKINSDGSLDKFKTRMVVGGDLRDKYITEDKWSPTPLFRSWKMFLAYASRLKVRVRQLDFFSTGKTVHQNVHNDSKHLWNPKPTSAM